MGSKVRTLGCPCVSPVYLRSPQRPRLMKLQRHCIDGNSRDTATPRALRFRPHPPCSERLSSLTSRDCLQAGGSWLRQPGCRAPGPGARHPGRQAYQAAKPPGDQRRQTTLSQVLRVCVVRNEGRLLHHLIPAGSMSRVSQWMTLMMSWICATIVG